MSELGTVLLENLAPRHEVDLSDLFCALSANGDGDLFYPHPLTPEEARRLCGYCAATVRRLRGDCAATVW